MDDTTPIIGEEGNVNHDDDATNIDSTDNEMTVDDVLIHTGSFGIYQFLILLLCMLFNVGISFQTLITYYTADDSPWVCTNLNISSFCSKEPFNEGGNLFTKRCTIHPDEWKYVYPKKYSIVTEYDLVCSKEYLKALVTSCFFIGCCVGSLMAGPLGDFFGRKPILVMSYLISFLASLAGYFVSATWQYLVLRVIIGFSFAKASVCVYIYLSENNTPKTRNWVGNVYFVAYTFSMGLVSLVCYFVPLWRKAVFYTSSFPLVALVLTFFLFESPHWLAAKGRFLEAEKILRTIAEINGKTISFKLKKVPKKTVVKKYSYFDLFNNCKVLRLTAYQSYLWLADGLVFYGIALESSNLGGSLYTNFILSSLADVPACFIAAVFCLYIGRRKSVFTFLLLGGVLCGTIGFLSDKLVVLKVILAMFCRMFLSSAFDVQFLWTFEINPTVVRSQGMNVCQFFSRVGSIAAPFFTSVMQDQDPRLPFFIMGAIALFGAFLALLLPETMNKPTREDYKDFFESNTKEVIPPTLNVE